MNIALNTSIHNLPNCRMLSMKQLTKYTSLSRSTLYDMMNVKSKRYDPTFPLPIKLTQSRRCWFELEVNAWLQSKIERSRTS